MCIRDDKEREEWRAEFTKELQNLIRAAERICEMAKPRGNTDDLWEDIDIVVGRNELSLDRLRRILNNWKDYRNDKEDG